MAWGKARLSIQGVSTRSFVSFSKSMSLIKVCVLTYPQNRRVQHAPVLNPSQKRGGQHTPARN